MNIKENKIKLLNKLVKYSDNLLNVLNKIEYTFNYLNNFNYSKYNIVNIHSIIENSFNINFVRWYNKLLNNDFENINTNFNKTFSFLYSEINNLINFYENTIKFYMKYYKFCTNKNLLLVIEYNNLCFNTKIDNKYLSEYFYTF